MTPVNYAADRSVRAKTCFVISPFDKRVKYNMYSAFRILIAHERRHLWQAEQAVDTLRKLHATAA